MVRERKAKREEVLTRPMLATIVRNIPDHSVQKAVARKATAERLTEAETLHLVAEVARAEPEQIDGLLSTNWLARPTGGPKGGGVEITSNVAARLEALITLAATLSDRLATLPRYDELEDQRTAAALDEELGALYVRYMEWQGQMEDATELTRLQQQNKELKVSNATLVLDLARCRETLGLGQRKYLEEQNVHG
jgi:hypothetical protein